MGEIRNFTNLAHFKTAFITSGGNTPVNGSVSYRFVPEKKLLPDFLAAALVRKPYGPVSFVDFGLTESILDGDLINAVELYSYASSRCARIAKKLDAKMSISSWETIPSNPLLFAPPFLFNVSRTKRKSDAFLVPTALAAKCLDALHLSRERVKCVRPGIELNLFSKPREDHEPFRILFAGRLDPEKGIDVLLTAFLGLRKRHKDVELWLCGPTRSGGVLEKKARELASKYPIKLIGEVSQDELKRIYAKCDVFCLPSVDRWKWGFKVWEEQFGWTLVEAMASGLPIVATECGAIREVVGDQNILVRQNSTEGLTNAFCRLIEGSGLSESIGKSNLERASLLYDIHKQRAELDRVLLELLESR